MPAAHARAWPLACKSAGFPLNLAAFGLFVFYSAFYAKCVLLINARLFTNAEGLADSSGSCWPARTALQADSGIKCSYIFIADSPRK
jgi:hypothetical protein